jgi:hypothetical protein
VLLAADSIDEITEMIWCVFRRNLPRHGFNFIRLVILSIVSPMLDSHERDWAKTRNEGLIGDKDVSAIGRLKYDAEAVFCYHRVKVGSNWTPCLGGRWLCASFAAKEELPNSVPHSQPA